jgi:hypothetical protein
LIGLRTLWAHAAKQPELAIEVTAEKEVDSTAESTSDNQGGILQPTIEELRKAGRNRDGNN